MQRILLNTAAVFIVGATLVSCGTAGKSTFRERVVPIAINITADNDNAIAFVNLNYFKLQLMDELRRFQDVDLTLVDADENPEVVLDMNINSFTIWPKDERTSRRVFRRNVQVGTDTGGRPLYQTVSASVDITQTQIRSNARFITKITYKGASPGVFERTFSPSYTYSNITADNIQGDSRAVDPGIYTAGSFNMEPREEEFLLALSMQELTRRVADEIRKHYK